MITLQDLSETRHLGEICNRVERGKKEFGTLPEILGTISSLPTYISLMKQKRFLVAILSLSVACAHGQTLIADSVSEFSGNQAVGNWRYGYYDKSGDTASPGYAVSDFVPMTQFQSGTWWVNNVDGPTGFFTRLDALGGHPNGLDNYVGRTRALREHFAVRRFLSPYSGLAKFEITIAKRDIGGTGQSFILYNNAAPVYNPNIAYTSLTPETLTFERTVRSGDVLDLFLGWGGQDANGLTRLDMRVSAVPETTPIITLGLGTFIVARKRTMQRKQSAL